MSTARFAPRTRAPDDLTLEQKLALSVWCNAKHPRLASRLAELVESCLLYHRAKGSLMADWVACAQTWVRNEAQGTFSRAQPTLPTRPSPGEYKPPVSDDELAEMRRRRELARRKL
jgi:hypothetical protein